MINIEVYEFYSTWLWKISGKGSSTVTQNVIQNDTMSIRQPSISKLSIGQPSVGQPQYYAIN